MFKLCTAGGEGGNVAAGSTFSHVMKGDDMSHTCVKTKQLKYVAHFCQNKTQLTQNKTIEVYYVAHLCLVLKQNETIENNFQYVVACVKTK
jgi:hypothetical protein